MLLNQFTLDEWEELVSLRVLLIGVLLVLKPVELLFVVVKLNEIILKLLFGLSLVSISRIDLFAYSAEVLVLVLQGLIARLFLIVLVLSDVL